MCGIYAALSASPAHQPSPELQQCLCNRGPDHVGTVQSRIAGVTSSAGDVYLTCTATVLSLRGDHVAQQPLVDEASGSVLCWNGEAWKIQGQLVQGNDGEAVLSLLTDASRRHDEDHVLNVLRSIEGPFAFIFFDKPSGRLYYGRDRLGRRSLLLHAGGPFVLSSIVEQPTLGWEEVEPDGCYVIQLHRTDTLTDFVRTRLEWIEDTTLVSACFGVSGGCRWADISHRFPALRCSISPYPRKHRGCARVRHPWRFFYIISMNLFDSGF